MTIESFIISKLSAATGLTTISVTGDVPEPTPQTFVTVEKTGERVSNLIHRATIAVQSWGPTRAEAMALNETVKAAMTSLISNSEISMCRLETDYNFTHTSSNHPRYQALFEVVYFLQEGNT